MGPPTTNSKGAIGSTATATATAAAAPTMTHKSGLANADKVLSSPVTNLNSNNPRNSKNDATGNINNNNSIKPLSRSASNASGSWPRPTTTSDPTVAVSQSSSSPSPSSLLWDAVWWSFAVFVFCKIAMAAYRIRMGSINEFGPVIHEFDPYFNLRATEYLYWNGWRRFFSWFDYQSWYPLGRPVGTTIYPGMQFTAVWIKQYILPDWSLNDICCYIPAWFGVFASTMTGLITYECCIAPNTGSTMLQYIMDFVVRGQPTYPQPNSSTTTGNHTSSGGVWFLPFHLPSPATECALATMAIMAVVPAHLMRSVGGGYDNESVAVSAMVLTFYFWVRSLRVGDDNSHWYGLLTAVAYFYMVAAWGGYVFVLNLIGVHAAVLVLLGRFTTKVYLSYSLFYVLGTALAIQVPVVGWAPLKSLEQLGPGAIFVGYQVLQLCEVIKRRQQLTRQEAWMMRMRVFSVVAVVALLGVVLLAPNGYFGPISARVRGLFVKHTKTGNPLVDSVAEHQPASNRAYFQYLHHACPLSVLGFVIVWVQLSEASSFLLVWGMTAYYFSLKMVRLILLTAPIASVLAGLAIGRLIAWSIRQWWDGDDAFANAPALAEVAGRNDGSATTSNESEQQDGGDINGKSVSPSKDAKKQRKKGKAQPSTTSSSSATARTAGGKGSTNSSFEGLMVLHEVASAALNTKEGMLLKRVGALLVFVAFYFLGTSFVQYCWRLSLDLSNPTIIVKAQRRTDGEIIYIDDYREAYWWLRDNTPHDARVMAWWDYGYHLSAIANRTTIADGNTWNHEHIGLLGKTLTTDLDEGWAIARHLADYVLIWGGGGGDDLAKSPHLARIANSVYRDHCPDDPTCRSFGFVDRKGTPSSMMARSLLYRLHGHKLKPGVEAPDDKFQEVFRSKYGKVRIFKIMNISVESKAWVANPANRRCDVPGSWFCPGQYPPGLSDILSRGIDFRLLEDFNRGNTDEEYLKRYFEDLHDPEAARRKALEREHREHRVTEQSPMSEDERASQLERMKEAYKTWEDTEDTTLMWRLINENKVDELRSWLEHEPDKAYIRSQDGRGPMWWAFEQRNEEITKLFMKAGVPHTDKDARGLTPIDLLGGVKR